MTLIANGESFKVTHSYPDHLVLADPVKLRPGQAELTISIDGEISKIPFEIPGAVSGQRIDADFSVEAVGVE